MTTTEAVSGAARLGCEVTGEGSPVVLVHAGIADSGMWDALLPALSAGHRTIRYDLRGYGRTALPAGSSRHLDDLAAVEQAVGAPAHLVGASPGGRVALDLALDRPELVRCLALIAAPVSGFEPDVEEPPLWDDYVAAHRRDDLDALADIETRMWLADPERTRLPAELLDLVRGMNRTALADERSGVAEEQPLEPPAVERLTEVAVPALVIVGEWDQSDIRPAADLLTDRLPEARRVELPGVAHLPALEAPEPVGRLLRAFLAGIDAPASPTSG